MVLSLCELSKQQLGAKSALSTKLALSRHQGDDTAKPQVTPHVAPQASGQVAMLEQAFAAATGQVLQYRLTERGRTVLATVQNNEPT